MNRRSVEQCGSLFEHGEFGEWTVITGAIEKRVRGAVRLMDDEKEKIAHRQRRQVRQGRSPKGRERGMEQGGEKRG